MYQRSSLYWRCGEKYWVKTALERLIGTKMIVPEEAQIVGAFGDALIAQEAFKHS
jgi:activator of 2-hydroxyglutaryl-CoA dehydratase